MVQVPQFRSFAMAGFECGFLGWNGHDLLESSGHVPHARMGEHYRIAREHGLQSARDGLPWRHDPAPRLRVAEEAGLEVVWDLNHFDPPPDPVGHARHSVSQARQDRPLWLCPVNEPMVYPMLAGMGWEAATDLAITMGRVARDHHPDVRFLATDPITGIGEKQFAATDRLVHAGLADVVGVNYYPHTARTSLSKVILKTWRRYGKPVLVSETSWHYGHWLQRRRFPGMNKARWWQHVLAEVAFAEAKGAMVAGVCWYPVVSSPAWDRSPHHWNHGLIQPDGSVDPGLSEEFLGRLSRAAAA